MAFRTVKLVFYHGGYVSEGPNKSYVGGNVSAISVDPDLLSFFEMKALIKELGCPEHCQVYHKSPTETMDDGLLCLSSDKAIVDMDTMHKMHGDVIDLYVHDPLLVPQKHSTQEGSSLTKAGSGQHDEESEGEWESGADTDDSDFSGFQESSEDDEEEEELNHVVITEPPIELMNEEGEHSDKSDDLQCMDNEEGEDILGLDGNFINV
ncbi:hypothetical protein Vadar_011025 [Vaccinium darrowii]|uniref:Uncharacterized protein n=1 Tax=Vaccinium darrowii TaxID=229202 RepID=A0ACB7XY74_9ERIC|nr:hypothetical protein Vadar_011025 [Vaccinium darrowii]